MPHYRGALLVRQVQHPVSTRRDRARPPGALRSNAGESVYHVIVRRVDGLQGGRHLADGRPVRRASQLQHVGRHDGLDSAAVRQGLQVIPRNTLRMRSRSVFNFAVGWAVSSNSSD